MPKASPNFIIFHKNVLASDNIVYNEYITSITSR